MTLYIKNMVCDRCILVVKQQFQELGIATRTVQLGEVEIDAVPDASQMTALADRLNALGFELLDNKKARTVEQTKTFIINLIQKDSDEELNKKLSVLLSEKMGVDYHYLSTLFTSVEGITIEKFAILQRIEKAKELLLYNELSLNDIAFKLGYSSVQHLSTQFKNVTGLTPSHFKKVKENRRQSLDKVGKPNEEISPKPGD